MIRIERPAGAPNILQDSGEREEEAVCKSYDLHADEYRTRERAFEFKEHIYGHDSVRNTLLEAQHRKCCYCESRFRANYPGAVEHFRPKGAVQQERSQRREYPGYYWLAYRWENLLVSCYSCNSIHKGVLFPLVDSEARARKHHDDMDSEQPLLVDPASEEPRQHIRFRGSASEPLTEKGRETIRVLELNRRDLEEDRREWLAILDTHQLTLRLGDAIDGELLERARRFLENAVRPDAKYSSMARYFLEPNNGRSDTRPDDA